MKLKIDKRLLPMKAHYFLFNAGTAPVVPFMPTLARQLGFSTVVVGTIYAILPVIGLLSKPLFGFIADKFQKHKTLFLLAQFLTAISFLCIAFIPAVPQSLHVQFDCNEKSGEIRMCPIIDEIQSDLNKIAQKLEDNYGNQTIACTLNCEANARIWDLICKNWNITEPGAVCPPTNDLSKFEWKAFIDMYHTTYLQGCLFFRSNIGQMNGKNATIFCPSNATTPLFEPKCEMVCEKQDITNIITEGLVEPQEVTSLYQFWLFVFLLVMSWAGMAIVVSVGDAICFELLGQNHHLYGNQRLWGAVGWGILAIISGLLVDSMSKGSLTKDYTAAFGMTFVILLLDMCASYKLETSKSKLSHNIFQDVGKVLLSVRVIVFFTWCICVGLCTGLIWQFLFWYLEDLGKDNKHMKTIQGLAMGVQCFGGELPFFFLSGWILKRIGHINAMSLVLFGFSVRLFFYSILSNPWWVLPIELLNGVTFGIFYSTMASYASIVAPPGTEATLQGLTGAIFEGIGVSSGSFIAGILYETYRGSTTFLVFSIGAFCMLCIHVAVQFVLKRVLQQQEGYVLNYHSPSMLLDEQDY